MKQNPCLQWYPILCWIFFVGFSLLESRDTTINNKKHSHMRRKSNIHHSNDVLSIDDFQENEDISILQTSSTASPMLSNFNNFFISPNYTVVQAQTLTTAVLHCEIQELGNSTVTWKRRRDFQILTFGLLTYSSDVRFFTRNTRSGRDWSLHIRYANTKDAGIYECQISSHPPNSIFVDLQLLEAHAEILGGPVKVVQAGSTLLLTCIVRRCTEVPEYIFWYHETRMINYDHHVTASNNHWNIDALNSNSEPSVRKNSTIAINFDYSDLDGGTELLSGIVRHHRQSSELFIADASERHSGNYSCVPAKAKPSSVTVHVLRVEKPAAMQHNKNISTRLSTNNLPLLIILYLSYLR